MRRARRRSALLLAAALAVLPAWRAAAQEAAPTPTATPTPEARPVEPVPLPRIAAASETAERAARKLAAVSEPDPAVVEIESLLPEQAGLLDDRVGQARVLAADPPSLIALNDELKSFDLVREQFAGWLALLTERLTALETAIDDVSHERKVWQATEKSAVEAEAPQALLAQIRDTRASLGDAKRSLEKRRDELLALQSGIARAEQRATEALDALTAAHSSFRSLLLLRDSEPLWSALRGGQALLTADLGETLAARWRRFVRFLELSTERLAMHLGLLVAALFATLLLKQRASAWRADDPRFEASAVIFERPVSAALLIALVLGPLLHPRAPRLANAILLAAVAVPIVRLLPRLLEPSLAPAVYVLTGLALLDGVRDVMAKAVLFERSLLLLETLGALAFLFWMLRPKRLAGLPPGTQISPWLRPVLRVAGALLAVAAVANLLGWMNLGRALTNGVLGSAYAAVVLYGGARILRTLLRAALRSRAARHLGVMRRHGTEVAAWSQRLVDAAAGLAWFSVALSAFGLAEWAGERLAAVLGAEAKFGTIAISLGDVLAFVLTIAGALVLSRLLRTVLEDDVLPRVRTARGVPLAVTSTVHYVLLLLGFLLAISAAGVDLNRVSLLAGALGVGIGFGLQNVVNNFVSGLILLYERPIQLGDTVEVGGLLGEVKRIGIRSSTIRTYQGAEVIVPNGNLISDQVVNWTFSDRRRRMEVKVGVAYGTDPDRVLALLLEVAAAHPGVLADPKPAALFLGFGESSLDFELRGWTDLFETWMQTQSELTVAVNRAIVEAGIEIPFPQRDLHLRTAEAEAFGTLRREAP